MPMLERAAPRGRGEGSGFRLCRSSPTWPTRSVRATAGAVLAGHGDRACGASSDAPQPSPADPSDAIVLNKWIARELGAAAGDRVSMDYYLWDPAAGLREVREFTVTAVVPMAGVAADRRLAPEYPGHHRRRKASPTGIRRSRSTCRESVRRTSSTGTSIRTTPKAFVPYERGARTVGDTLRHA